MSEISTRKYEAKLLSKDVIALGVHRIKVEIIEKFEYIAGQYVWLEIPELGNRDKKGNRRAFSIANASHGDNVVEIVFRNTNSEYKKSILSLPEGSQLFVHGPFGSSFVPRNDSDTDTIVMIAGGVGIAPFISVIRSLSSTKKNKAYLAYLCRNQESIAFEGDIKEEKNKSTKFDYHISFEIFSVADYEKIKQFRSGKTKYWIAGTKEMVNHVFAVLKSAGVDREDMVFENYYPSRTGELTEEIVSSQLEGGSIFAKAIQNSTNHTIITDTNGVVLFANRAAEEITGYTKEEIIGNTPRLWGGLMDGDFYVDFWKKKRSGEAFSGEIPNRRKNGEIYYTIAHIAPIKNSTNEIIGYIGTEEDITTIRDRERELEIMNSAMIDREIKMVELKERIKALENPINKDAR